MTLQEAKDQVAKSRSYESWSKMETIEHQINSGSWQFILKATDEAAELYAKEAADKAWEAAWNRFRQEEYGRVPPTLPNKETFMKELFKDHG